MSEWKDDPLLHHKEAFGLLHHPFDVVRIILGPVAGTLAPLVAIVAAHLVAHLAAQQLVGRDIRGLAGDIPKRVLDRADRRAIRLEAAALADLQHAALDVRRVLADQRIAEVEHEWLEVGLGEFHLAKAVDVFVRHDADDGMSADNGAAEVDDFHASAYSSRLVSQDSPRFISIPRPGVLLSLRLPFELSSGLSIIGSYLCRFHSEVSSL